MSSATAATADTSPAQKAKLAPFTCEEPFLLSQQLTEDERIVQDSARGYCQESRVPGVLMANRNGTFDRRTFLELGANGFLGIGIEGDGCPGGCHVMYGLIAREVEGVDSAYRSAMSVQSSLVMFPIYPYRSEERRVGKGWCSTFRSRWSPDH